METFMVTVESLDFTKDSKKSIGTINSWIAEQTNNKITDILSSDNIDQDTKMVLVNAIYFKGEWKYMFHKEHTEEKDFYVSEDTTLKVPMMYIKGMFEMAWIEQAKARALRMPYKGETMDMVFVLPDEGETMDSFEKRLESVDFSKINWDGKLNVHVVIPRFKVESTHPLMSKLKEMGAADMFSGSANLSGISSDRDLYVSEVLQKAFIEVNEEGAEAAAVTVGASIAARAFYQPHFEFFTCNRPFYFYIQERKNGIIFFSGKVVNPVKN